MLIKSLSSIRKYILLQENLILFNLSYNQKKMSTLENVIDGLNDVKSRIKVAVQKRNQVFIIY